MKIQWLGHSCFKLVESTGTTIVTDPYGDVGYQMPLTRADAVTISHDHYDHNNLKAIEGNPPVFTQPGLYDVKGVRVTGVSSFHDDRKGAQRGKNTIFMFHMDGLDICHLGDVGHEITPALVESLMSCNVLLIPVGGTYTIDAELAKEYVDALMPEIVIPMHYKTKSLTLDIDRAEDFLRKFDENDVEISESDTVELDREDIDEQSTRVILLRRAKDRKKE